MENALLALWNPIVKSKVALGKTVAARLRKTMGKKIRAEGLRGSVARGTAGKYSDIDFLIITRRPTDHPRFHITKNTYCSFTFETWKGVVGQLTRPSPELAEILGGFTRILPIYDPENLLPKIEKRAGNIPKRLFRESARLALLHSYEDFCRVKNAYLIDDAIVLKDNIPYVTHSAALVVASLNETSFESDRTIFKAHKGFKTVPRQFDGRLMRLRYGNLKGRKLFNTFLAFYLDLVEFAKEQGISFPVSEEALRKMEN